MTRKCIVFVVAGICLLILGCASNSNFQTAQTLGKGNAQALAGLTIMTFGKDSLAEVYGLKNFFIFEMATALGVSDNFDFGMKYIFPSQGFIETKYCIIGRNNKTEGMFSALGLRVGFTALPKDTIQTYDPNRSEFAVPVYISYYPSSLFGISVIPTGAGRYYFSKEIAHQIHYLAGCNGNIRIGKKVGIFAEASYFRNITERWNELQFGGGLFFDIRRMF